MGNTVSAKENYNVLNNSELKYFVRDMNLLDGLYNDTSLSVSSQCLVVLNNLINYSIQRNFEENNYGQHACEILPETTVFFDEETFRSLENLKLNLKLIQHLLIFNSNSLFVEEFIKLDNFSKLISLHIENIPVRFLHHLKLHRESLLKLTVHGSISSMVELIEKCGGDQSFSGAWINLKHLDVRYNCLKIVDDSVNLLTALTVLDISRNDIRDFSFIDDIPTLVCLNASFNRIKHIPIIQKANLKVLILGYNCLDSLEGIKNLKNLISLNVSFNIISTNESLQQLKEIDTLQNVILKGNPLCFSKRYHYDVLDVISMRVPVSFCIDGKTLNKKEDLYLRKTSIIRIEPATVDSSFKHNQVSSVVQVIDTGDRSNENEYSNSGKRRNILERELNSRDGRFISPIESIISTPFNPFNVDAKIEKIIEGSDDVMTDYESGMATDKSVSTKFIPYYVGPKTSMISIITHEEDSLNRIESVHFRVSIQAINYQLMAVDLRNIAVDNIDINKLIMIRHSDNQENEMILVFVEREIAESEAHEFVLSIRKVSFENSVQFQELFDQLTQCLQTFRVTFDDKGEIPLERVNLKCLNCTFPLSTFSTSSSKPVTCKLCERKVFVLNRAYNAQSNVTVQANESISAQIFQSTLQVLNSKPQTNGTMQTESESATGQFNQKLDIISECDGEESSVFEDAHKDNLLTDTTFSSLVDGQSESEATNYFSPRDDAFVPEKSEFHNSVKLTEKLDENLSSFLDQPVPLSIGDSVYKKGMKIHTILSKENDSFTDWWTKCEKKEWVIEEPLSNVQFYMHSKNKVDGRIKMHFLTKVLKNEEDLKGVFKVLLIHKYPQQAAIQVLLILSNRKIFFYEWIDKDSAYIEDCLKFIVEYKLKNLTLIDYLLNNQVIEIQFKNKHSLLIFVGDITATKTIGYLITDTVSCKAVRFTIRSLKILTQMKGGIALVDELVKTANTTEKLLQTSQSFLLNSSSLLINLSSSQIEYVPKFIVVEAENIFLITMNFINKDSKQIEMKLEHVISMYSLTNKLNLYQRNLCTCGLLLFESGSHSSVQLEFFTPSTRSKAVDLIASNYKELFQMEINFVRFDDGDKDL